MPSFAPKMVDGTQVRTGTTTPLGRPSSAAFSAHFSHLSAQNWTILERIHTEQAVAKWWVSTVDIAL
jgi:hypothetical protein